MDIDGAKTKIVHSEQNYYGMVMSSFWNTLSHLEWQNKEGWYNVGINEIDTNDVNLHKQYDLIQIGTATKLYVVADTNKHEVSKK